MVYIYADALFFMFDELYVLKLERIEARRRKKEKARQTIKVKRWRRSFRFLNSDKKPNGAETLGRS